MTPRMDVSRNAFGRVLTEGRNAAANALVKDRALRIKGGDDELKPSAVSGGRIEKS